MEVDIPGEQGGRAVWTPVNLAPQQMHLISGRSCSKPSELIIMHSGMFSSSLTRCRCVSPDTLPCAFFQQNHSLQCVGLVLSCLPSHEQSFSEHQSVIAEIANLFVPSLTDGLVWGCGLCEVLTVWLPDKDKLTYSALGSH